MNLCTKRTFYALFLLFLIVGTIWIVRFRGTSTLRIAEGAIFGTTYHIKYEASEPLDSAILRELKSVDASLSVFNPLSTVSLINSGKNQKADAMLYDVMTKAKAVSENTKGAFDITVMPLVNAWGFGFKHGNFPSNEMIDSLKSFVNFHYISLAQDSSIVKEKEGIMLDFGAIAKGYGVDRVARLLREKGVRNYLVEIGGEVVTKGRNPEGHPWKVGISKPVEGSSPSNVPLQAVLNLENAALATSGNYQNYYEHDGRKYAHTIDPRTGRPVQHSLLSATVVAPDCATADAYATAFMVMGMEEALKIVKQQRGLKVFFIYADKDGKLNTYSTIKF